MAKSASLGVDSQYNEAMAMSLGFALQDLSNLNSYNNAHSYYI